MNRNWCRVWIALCVTGALGCSGTGKPDRVLIVVMDQLRPEYVDLFDLANVRALTAGGVSFPNAYLGHMAAESAVSHAVLTSGALPKRLGFSDEVHRDAAGALHVTAELNPTGLLRVPTLADALHRAFPGTRFIAVGEERGAAFAAGGPSADVIVTLGGPDPDCGGWRGPDGINVPASLSDPPCGRFSVDGSAALDYGTGAAAPAWMLPEEGDAFVPGRDPDHLGGDTWAADAAMALMETEPWSGMVVSLAGVDQASHRWGGATDTAAYAAGSDEEMTHLRFIARNADAQLGRMLEKLGALGLRERTLIVLTAGHGGAPSSRYHGVDQAGRAPFNWYYGGSYLQPSPSLDPLLASGNVAFSFQDSAIRAWLADASLAKKQEAAAAMRSLPDVIATYYRQGDYYELDSDQTDTNMTTLERDWWAQHGNELVDTMAAPWAADVVSLLSDEASYGVAADHGGAQRAVQQIPMVLSGPGLAKGAAPLHLFRMVDLMPTVLDQMGVTPTAPLDGAAVPLPAPR